MRTDEEGNECPHTLGEYRDLCAAINANSEAVAFLDHKIATTNQGRDAEVIVDDGQMRVLLMPLLVLPPSGKYMATPPEHNEG